jgi:hypothetical protein
MIFIKYYLNLSYKITVNNNKIFNNDSSVKVISHIILTGVIKRIDYFYIRIYKINQNIKIIQLNIFQDVTKFIYL